MQENAFLQFIILNLMNGKNKSPAFPSQSDQCPLEFGHAALAYPQCS